MPGSRSEVYLHLVWTTWDRRPFLTGEVKGTVYRCIRDGCNDLGATVISLNGVEDHVHLLARVPGTLSASTLAKKIKGGSSHRVHTMLGLEEFRWQEGYTALSVSRWDVSNVQKYIEKQEEHHAMQAVKEALEP